MTVYENCASSAVDPLARSVVFREGDVSCERAPFFEAAARCGDKIILVLDRLSRATDVTWRRFVCLYLVTE